MTDHFNFTGDDSSDSTTNYDTVIDEQITDDTDDEMDTPETDQIESQETIYLIHADGTTGNSTKADRATHNEEVIDIEYVNDDE